MRTTLTVALVAGAAAQPGLTGLPQPGLPQPGLPQPGLPQPGLPQQRGMVVGTSYGVDDSDNACARGVVGACGLPNIANMFNPDVNMRYQTQASDLALSSVMSSGRYSATGARVVTGNPMFDQNTLDIPTWTAGGAINTGGLYTTGAYDWTRTPIASQINYITGNPAAPNAFTPSASNALLPGSSAFGLANAAPWLTTAPNPLTSAGYGYSTAISGTSNIPLNGFASTPSLGRPFGASTGFGFNAPFSTGFGASPFSGFSSAPFSSGFSSSAPFGGFSSSAPFGGFSSSAPFGGFSSAPFGGFSSAPFGGFSAAPFGGFSSAPFGGFSSSPFSSAPFGGFRAPATLTAPATTGFMGTPLTTAPAFQNAWTQNANGFAPAAGVAPTSF